jgi:small conductance mechanosensitive channel
MPQSISQLPRQTPPADTTGAVPPPDTNSVASGLGNINSELGRAISLFLEGDFQGMYRLLYENAINVLGLFLENGLKALLAFLVLYVIYKAVDKTLDRVLEHSRRVDAGLQSLLQRSFRVTAYIFIGSMVLGQLGVNVTALVAGLSIAGIVAGFAARDSLENFISGVTILVDQPFKVGDYIVVEDQYGQVDEITLRSTRIRTVRNEVMVLPNTQMITQPVVNHTKQNTLRVDIEFGIAYKEYPEEAREVLLPLVEDDDRILPRPEPTVVVTEMADSAVNMVLRMYLRDPSEELAVRWDYTERVREALREADIEIPFPHRQLFLDEAKAFAGTPLLERSNGSSPDDGGNGEA